MQNSILVDLKYVSFLQTRLLRFKSKGKNVFQARCPVCNDSATNQYKARFFIYPNKGTMFCKCHNCGYCKALPAFLKVHMPDLYPNYCLDTFAETNQSTKPVNEALKPAHETKKVGGILSGLNRISQLRVGHPAKKYVEGRQLPTSAHAKLYYTSNFTNWINELQPGKLRNTGKLDPRLVIPLIDRKGEVFAVQGRALNNQVSRYLTVRFDEITPKIYGLNSIDPNRRTYVFEGPLDSLFIPNSVAMAGSDCSVEQLMKYTGAPDERLVFVLDNQPRNKDVVHHMEQLMEAGHQVVVWPLSYKQKDVNAMVLAGRTIADIQLTIDNNIYTGLEGKLQLSSWSKN